MWLRVIISEELIKSRLQGAFFRRENATFAVVIESFVNQSICSFLNGIKMSKKNVLPELVFETSWEVCNKVGGIYTVLSTRAKTLCDAYEKAGVGRLVFLGPDVWSETPSPYFTEDATLLPDWKTKAEEHGMKVRIGRWNVPGNPVAVLIDFAKYYEKKDVIYEQAWRLFGVDSLHAYGDYDESSMFSFAAGRFAEVISESFYTKKNRIIYQAHEWMSGLGMLFLKHHLPWVKTIFTTHATSIGRSITTNNKNLYEYFSGYNGDQMARELNMEAKHSVEKQSAHYCDCFTTVSAFTDKECVQLLEKAADVVLPNGFEADFVPKGTALTKVVKEARAQLLRIGSALTGVTLDDSTFIFSTSGRNDFRCKGFDVYMQSIAQLKALVAENPKVLGKHRHVLALIEVPCWVSGPRADLQTRLADTAEHEDALPNPFLTHDLHNFSDDRIVRMMQELGLTNEDDSPVKTILIPSYLEGADGIFDTPYYSLLAGNDLCVYPSYYEPWGYTPLESCAFSIPTITTDLSGFGQWVNEVLGRQGAIEDGVAVLHRDDNNYYELATEMTNIVAQLLQLPKTKLAPMRRAAKALAAQAEWKHFIEYYYKAYTHALKRA